MRLRKRLASQESNVFEQMKQIHHEQLEKLSESGMTEYEEDTFTIQTDLENGHVLLSELMADNTIVCSYWDDAMSHKVLVEVKAN
jgi:hypothetical protein